MTGSSKLIPASMAQILGAALIYPIQAPLSGGPSQGEGGPAPKKAVAELCPAGLPSPKAAINH